METRIALVGIIVEDTSAAAEANEILHQFGRYIVGRMGVPYRGKGICIISVIIDAPQQEISAMSGRLGKLPGISVKTLYSKAGQAHGQ